MNCYKSKFRTIVLTAAIICKISPGHSQDKFIVPIDEGVIKTQKAHFYKSAGPQQLHFDLYQPAQGVKKQAPVVVLMNGFGSAPVKMSTIL